MTLRQQKAMISSQKVSVVLMGGVKLVGMDKIEAPRKKLREISQV